MKKSYKKFFIVSTFIVFYSLLLSAGVVTSIKILGNILFSGFDAGSIVPKYPRFMPFCFAVSVLSFFSLFILLNINKKMCNKINYTKILWLSQTIISVIISVFLLKPYDMIFDFLQTTF